MRSFIAKRSLMLTTMLILSQAAGAQSVTGNVDAQMFRSIFSNLVDSKGTDQNRVDHLIYAPIPELLSGSDVNFAKNGVSCQVTGPLSETYARKTLCEMQKDYSASNAAAFFKQGQSTGKLEVDLAALTRNLQQQDLLIVVVPGIFGEFIKGRAFEEVFEKDTAYGRQFHAALEKQTRAQLGAGDCASISQDVSVCDKQEQLKRLSLVNESGSQQVPMGELMNVASIDDANGEPTAKVVLFQLDGMTLESLGRQEDRAAIFNRRLKKLFQIMNHTPKNIAFVGYSRGTAFALEMLSQARSNREPWLANVRGVVSIGGVVLGSALADEALSNPKSAAHCQLELEGMLEQILTELPDLNQKPYEKPNQDVLLRNTMGWYRFLVANSRFASGKYTCDQVKDLHSNKVDKEEVKLAVQMLVQTARNQSGADPDFGRKMVMAQAAKFGLVDDTSHLGFVGMINFATNVGTCLAAQSGAECLREFAPDATKYNTDIRRFRKLVAAVRQGVEELSTDSRLKWWQTHTIPTQGIRFYSVSGTMADESTELGNNRFGLNPKSPDDIGLVQNWKDYSKVTISGEYAGVNLNDSQVAIYKTAFWPNIIASLNPANSGIRYSPLAVVGTHHWGMALPIVTEVPANSRLLRRNPFPRFELMQSIALSVAHDISVDSGKGE